MRVASLQPFATDILTRCGIGSDLVAVSHLCEVPKSCGRPEVVSRAPGQPYPYADKNQERLALGIGVYAVDVKKIVELAPDVVVGEVVAEDVAEFIAWAESYLASVCGRKVKLLNVSIATIAEMAGVVEEIGAVANGRAEARTLVGKTQAQLMAWADSFFDRCKGKRVVVLSSVTPLVVAARWIPDLVRLLGGKTLEQDPKRPQGVFTWDDVVAARPDVLVIAPEGEELGQSVKALKTLQALPNWEELPAVKRGEVIFCPGTDLYRAGPRFLKGAAILVSAVAGLDSGYITERDSYFKVRYLELHRHRFL